MLSIPPFNFMMFVMFSRVIYAYLLCLLTRSLLYGTFSTPYFGVDGVLPVKLSLAIDACGNMWGFRYMVVRGRVFDPASSVLLVVL